jgi:SAM-dependent methyltransferase
LTNEYTPRDYWAHVAEDFGSRDHSGLAPVLHPDAPEWYNRAIDALQFGAMREAIRRANLQSGAHFLDVGCGTGRWLRRYSDLGFRVTGVDATPAMLSLAKKQGTGCALVSGESFRLPFPDSSFDVVSDVTVIQHIVPGAQPLALAENLRVIRPGGNLILMELIRGTGPHIFPHRPSEWIDAAASSGARLISWFGQEFMIIDRAFCTTSRYLHTRRTRTSKFPISTGGAASKSTAARLYWGVRRITVPISARMESITRAILPGAAATHAVFIFSK